MALNIKNPRTTALVRELAQRSGMSQTQAVDLAVRERLASLDAQEAADARSKHAKRDAAAALLKRLRASLSETDLRALGAAETELYDGDGLPR